MTDYLGFLFIFTLTFTPPCKGVFNVDPCLENLVLVAYEQTVSRNQDHYQAFIAWKNTQNTKPAIVNLSQWNVKRSKALGNLLVHCAYEQNPTLYEEAVFHLKQGDSVVFDENVFTLGPFLGSGNATHIFELANHPGHVIRIPFLSGYNNYRGKTDHGSSFSFAKQRMKNFVKKIASSQQAVAIITSDPQHRYAVVSKVHGTQNADSFLTTISDGGFNAIHNVPNESTILEWLQSAESTRAQSLLRVLQLNNDDWTAARQYIWDLQLLQWIKIDH